MVDEGENRGRGEGRERCCSAAVCVCALACAAPRAALRCAPLSVFSKRPTTHTHINNNNTPHNNTTNQQELVEQALGAKVAPGSPIVDYESGSDRIQIFLE